MTLTGVAENNINLEATHEEKAQKAKGNTFNNVLGVLIEVEKSSKKNIP